MVMLMMTTIVMMTELCSDNNGGDEIDTMTYYIWKPFKEYLKIILLSLV